jgi:hypothetical protein
MAVNEQEVRNLLDKPAAGSVAQGTINENINRAVLLVNNVKNATSSTNMVDEAVKALAVWTSYGSYMEGISRDLGSTSLADDVKLDHYRKIAELFLAQISSQPVDLEDPVESAKGAEIPVDPSVATLSTSEAYPNG